MHKACGFSEAERKIVTKEGRSFEKIILINKLNN